MNKTVSFDIRLTFEFYSHLRKLCRQLELQRDVVAKEHEITGSQAYLLWAIDDNQNCTLSKLANVTGFALNTTSTLVKGLVTQNYVYYQRSEADARASVLSLTERGNSILMLLLKSWQTNFAESYSRLLQRFGATETVKALIQNL